MKIIWSKFAKLQLDEIYFYLSKRESKSFAIKFRAEIISEPAKLLENPLICQQEEFLKKREIIYRYMVFKSYKIIYSINSNGNEIIINDVFHTKQNPSKLNRTI
ncbi:hypothetical protein A5893_16105 [Pedobacter psychrophilus]|uniref:Plasmid stabilization protein n=1 Tax=Pedobacter psychrophilus TaxID=1826909 RepID=A0A179DB84_9SPHI|nr:type II toxin-antitoxin system RelE/ParE family toxin [Pedobacter psychrophilus]OAQ38311.1 hypothetical protein A5893_16105 [Pedobacter psychrophilus]